MLNLVDQPPFAVRAGLSLAEETGAIERVRAHLHGLARPATWVCERILDRHAWARDCPECAAALLIARDIDAGVLAAPLPYHHRLHFCDVVLAAHYIGLLQRFSDEQMRVLVLAALIHDIGHEGGSNADRPFHFERRSVAIATPYLQRIRLADPLQRWIAAMVLATDTTFGLPRVRSWYRHHVARMDLPPGDEPDPSFVLFRDHATLVVMALALSEADALASAGLSECSADEQERRIAEEMGFAASANGKLAYLERMFPDGFLIAAQFNPNLEHLKERARRAALA